MENRLKSANLRLIRELIRNSRKSDRELAKLLGISQPTVSRNRERLEKEGFIEYTGVPNLQKLGIEIIAITFGNWKHEQYPYTKIAEAREFAKRHPNLVFLSSGRGVNSDRVAVSVHKDYADYSNLMREIKTDWGKFMDVTGSFLISLSNDEPLRSITFKYLADYLEEKES